MRTVSRDTQLSVDDTLLHNVGIISVEGELKEEHGEEHAAQGPDIQHRARLGVNTFQNLRCHELQSTRISLIIDRGCGAAGYTEIHNLDPGACFGLKKNILQLQVSVNDTLAVAHLDSRAQLLEYLATFDL